MMYGLVTVVEISIQEIIQNLIQIKTNNIGNLHINIWQILIFQLPLHI
jgi:hypothetical protein